MPKKQIKAHCGGNSENKTAWGQGIAGTKAAATAAAKADFLLEVAKETAWLTDWADSLYCPHSCRYKLVLPIRKQNYNETKPRWNETKHAFIVDITEDYSITVQCFPLKPEDMKR
jgi:hypothetical protein